jgi:hypothetical protein
VAAESSLEESEEIEDSPRAADADASARRFLRVAAGELAAKKRRTAAIQVTRDAKTPNGKQTLL